MRGRPSRPPRSSAADDLLSRLRNRLRAATDSLRIFFADGARRCHPRRDSSTCSAAALQSGQDRMRRDPLTRVQEENIAIAALQHQFDGSRCGGMCRQGSEKKSQHLQHCSTSLDGIRCGGRDAPRQATLQGARPANGSASPQCAVCRSSPVCHQMVKGMLAAAPPTREPADDGLLLGLSRGSQRCAPGLTHEDSVSHHSAVLCWSVSADWCILASVHLVGMDEQFV